VFKFLHLIPLPIVSRYGHVGARLIDGCYTNLAGLEKTTSYTTVTDTGFSTDHDMIVHGLHLGIEHATIKDEVEERIDFNAISAIPIKIKEHLQHPVLDEGVFKGNEYAQQIELVNKINKAAADPISVQQITDANDYLQQFEKEIIQRTKRTLSNDMQQQGILVAREADDNNRLNTASNMFFKAIAQVCTEANLVKKVPLTKARQALIK
jgi:hypothetical protein